MNLTFFSNSIWNCINYYAFGYRKCFFFKKIFIYSNKQDTWKRVYFLQKWVIYLLWEIAPNKLGGNIYCFLFCCLIIFVKVMWSIPCSLSYTKPLFYAYFTRNTFPISLFIKKKEIYIDFIIYYLFLRSMIWS